MRKVKRRNQVHFAPGTLLTPLVGTTDWAPDGTSRGVWGRDKPLRYLVRDGDNIRPLTRQEHRAACAFYGPPDQPPRRKRGR